MKRNVALMIKFDNCFLGNLSSVLDKYTEDLYRATQ